MPASSQASSELSTASLTVVSSALAGLSKPSRCRFLVKNSLTEISRWRVAIDSAVARRFGGDASSPSAGTRVIAGGSSFFDFGMTDGENWRASVIRCGERVSSGAGRCPSGGEAARVLESHDGRRRAMPDGLLAAA